MVRPVNGQHYDTYILSQYFDLVVDGAAGADDVTLAAIAAINAIPQRVTYAHRDIVAAARVAYNKIASKLQQSLVPNYDVLVSAEQRISALTPKDEPTDDGEQNTPDTNPTPPANDTGDAKKQNFEWLAWVVIGMGVVGVAVAVFFDRRGIKKATKTENAPEQSTEKNDTEA
jgi:hypothetical protein